MMMDRLSTDSARNPAEMPHNLTMRKRGQEQKGQSGFGAEIDGIRSDLVQPVSYAATSSATSGRRRRTALECATSPALA